MKVNKTELIESIKKLNKEKHLMEGTDIQRATLPADADALEQHQEALKQNAERRDPKNYDKEVKEIIQETASEESRYRHFDVVDRKELAKKINEAKEKGLDFKVSRSTKEGFRYDLKVLNEDFMKKEAGDPDVNTAAFNHATDVGASSPTTGLGEDLNDAEDTATDTEALNTSVDGAKLAKDLIIWLKENSFDEIEDVISYLTGEGWDNDQLEEIFSADDPSLILGVAEKCPECEDEEDPLTEGCGDEDLGEELKVFTANLDNFHPSERCKDFWNEIKDAHKEEDLEYALETIYPDGISDVALDDMLCYEEDWIRDLIDLPAKGQEGEKEDESHEVIDEFEDEDIEPVDLEYPEDDIADDTEVEPITDEEPVDDDVEVSSDSSDDTDTPVEDTPEAETSPEDEKEEEEDLKEDKSTEPTDSELGNLAEAFFKKNFKPNTLNLTEGEGTKQEQQAEAVKQSITTPDDEEVVAVDDELVENMLGLPKSEETKKD